MASAAALASTVAAKTDPLFPGTAVQRLLAVHDRVRQLSGALDGDWADVRRKLLWAGGLKDLPDAEPGMGYTGHSFNDFNHCDLTTMLGEESFNEHDGQVAGIALGNKLGAGIKIASLPLGEDGSGSWTTCMMGCNSEPPRDVAHVQFRSKIAFKLVWCPDDDWSWSKFVLVDDDGQLLASGRPTGTLPHEAERRGNFDLVQGSKYALAAIVGGRGQEKAEPEKPGKPEL